MNYYVINVILAPRSRNIAAEWRIQSVCGVSSSNGQKEMFVK